ILREQKMGDADPVRFMLRAEIRCSDQQVIASGFELTDEAIFVITEWSPPVDTVVSLRLSFPTLVPPVELAARVREHRPAGAPGEPGGIELAFEPGSVRPAAALAEQLRRLSASASARPPAPIVGTY